MPQGVFQVIGNADVGISGHQVRAFSLWQLLLRAASSPTSAWGWTFLAVSGDPSWSHWCQWVMFGTWSLRPSGLHPSMKWGCDRGAGVRFSMPSGAALCSSPTASLCDFPLLLYQNSAHCGESPALKMSSWFCKGLWYILVSIYAISSFIPSPNFLWMPSSSGDLLPFSVFRFLLENLYLIFMPVIIQGEKGSALGAQSENKTAHFGAVT